jgi:plasmid maintenance system antidote protein VapI
MTKFIAPPSPPTLQAYLAGPPAVSQRALADAVGCNQSMISMLIRGTRVPSAALAVRLHTTTGVPLKALLAPKLKKVRPKARPKAPPRRGGVALAHSSP